MTASERIRLARIERELDDILERADSYIRTLAQIRALPESEPARCGCLRCRVLDFTKD